MLPWQAEMSVLSEQEGADRWWEVKLMRHLTNRALSLIIQPTPVLEPKQNNTMLYEMRYVCI